jgi:hypothetical protein
MVIAPDIILDLIHARGRRTYDAMMLLDAIAADIEGGNDQRPAYIAPVTLPAVDRDARTVCGPSVTRGIMADLLRLLIVIPLVNDDYDQALNFAKFAYEDALQFVACRRVGAKYLVTATDIGKRRAPVLRRTAAEMLPFFRKR